MISLTGYHISALIHQSSNSLVYRGYRESDNLPIILKVLRHEYPTPTQLTRYKQEYQITRNLERLGVIKAYSLENYQNTLAIVFEDFGGESLKILAARKSFTLKEFLQIAIAICTALEEIHGADLIHKDINPSNIVYNLCTQQLKIIDFGISTQLSQESPTFKDPHLLEGTLAYIAPEQTGRMNRVIDYRSDFYSLGVTFYELLVGKLPFNTRDLLELIHCHIAKQPANIPRQIPAIVSDIVMKLMAKTVEQRYQSAWGIKADLEECLQQLETTGTIETFPLATQDILSQFKIPQKLYGIEQELACLQNSFERVAAVKAQSKSELFLVSGYSGIGKSALVKEIQPLIAAKQGYFISGKFEQYQKNIPYYAVIQALQELIGQLLTETETQLKHWKDKLINALGINGQVMIEVIPELESIIGKQPAIPKLEPAESQNRFNLVFQNFVNVFARSEHPLVIFLDDLQWTDLASLKLIQLLCNASNLTLLLIGAYRSNEVDAAHPLILAIAEIQKTNIINRVFLNPLDLENINRLVSDTLQCSESVTESLSKLLQIKTNGNPFFLREFLKSLNEERLLQFDTNSRSWRWNLEQIEAQQITDNVVQLMSQKIQKLKNRTQEILKLSSCIGNQFDLQTLAIIAESSLQEVALVLHDAIAQGFILPLTDAYKSIELNIISEGDIITQIDYKFAHDRIQQATYASITQEGKTALHLRIGRLLCQKLSTSTTKIFDIVNQFNAAIELITDVDEQNILIELNRQAAGKAKASGAYQSAFDYLRVSMQLLPKDSWIGDRDRTLDIYQEIAEVAYLQGNHEQMNVATEAILKQKLSVLDKVRAYEIKIKSCFASGDLALGIKLALEILQLLGFSFPYFPNKNQVKLSLSKTRANLHHYSIESLVDLPPMEDSTVKAAMRIIQFISIAVYMSDPNLYILMSLKRIDLSLKYGNAYESAIAYTTYAWIVASVSKDITTGYQFGELAFEVLKRFRNLELEPCILFLFNTFIVSYRQHLRKTFASYMVAYKKGLEVGDLMHASSSITYYIIYAYFSGVTISKLEQEATIFYERLLNMKQQNFIDLVKIYRQVFANWLGTSDRADTLMGKLCNETEILSFHQKINNQYVIYHLYLQKSILCYIFQVKRTALENIERAREIFVETMGQVLGSQLNFYDSLIALANYNSADKSEKDRIRQRVNTNQNIVKTWATYAPMNYLHQYYLVEAEKQRVLGKHSEAINSYDRAIELAHKHKYLREEALAYELAAKFYLARENNLVAATYMKQARFCYGNWGANAKVKQLDSQYPQLLAEVVQQICDRNNITTISSETKPETLDLATLIKTSQALAQITDLEQLLQTLLKFVMENAGAQKGFLILMQSDNLIIRAKGTTEEITTLQVPLVDSLNLSKTIVNYVFRTQKELVLANANNQDLFVHDEYISTHKIKSVLCLPILDRQKVTGILYLENNLAEDVFTAERLEILKLISAQAAISIENALLRQKKTARYEYQVGGCLTANAPTYVVRQADIDLYKHLKQGQYCYILNSRHTGKSSLRVRTMNRLEAENIVCVAIDLTSIGSNNITPEQWYAGVIYSLVNSLELSNKFNFRNWWRSLELLSPVQRFGEFIRQILLKKITGKIVIFIDEIDSTLGLNFNMDDFFAVIRSCYNNRANNANYQRLSFVLLGVASPSSLVQDKNCTPFNIGRAIALQGFQLHEIEPLIKGLADKYSNPETILKEILAWTEGQPFLTQKICNLVAETQNEISEAEAAWVKQLIHKRVIDNWESQDDPQHFKTIGDRLFHTQFDSVRLLQLYKQILQKGAIVADGSNAQQELLLSGLVKGEGGRLKTYNRIYRSVFDLSWCQRSIDR